MDDLTELTDEEVLLEGLDLPRSPTPTGQTLQQLGIPADYLDYQVREWINGRFRLPRGQDLLVSGDLKVSMTWEEFLEAALGD